MTTRPTRIVQTTTEVKKAYKKNGSRLSEDQKRQLERGLELDNRAAKARAQEERKRATKIKRQEKERKEREARRQLGVGLATQLVGYSHTQARLKSGMESFLGLRKQTEAQENTKARALEVNKKLEAIAETVEQDPWDDEEAMDFGVDDVQAPRAFNTDSWIDDDLDDETLLEVHDLVVPDAFGKVRGKLPDPRGSPQKPLDNSVDRDFQRLHGPINKAIENVLEKLPDPLIELLSIDHSTNQPTWSPPASLLHKLNPLGIPPHRLRIKVGCVVSLLRDLDSTSRLSKSSHLRILRVENECLECMVLDGSLEGTRTILTRLPFLAKYRNEDSCPFQRLQFPIRVSVHFTPPKRPSKKPPVKSQPAFYYMYVSARYPGWLTPLPDPTKPCLTPGRDFKRPGLPASKLPRPATPCTVQPSVTPIASDGWDDFLDSGTQIARELSLDRTNNPTKSTTDAVSPLEDCSFTLDDLEEMVSSQIAVSSSRTHSLVNTAQSSSRDGIESSGTRMTPTRPVHKPNLKRKVRFESPKHPAKRPTIQSENIPPKPVTSVQPFPFGDLGWSTQEAASFFDDDEFTGITG